MKLLSTILFTLSVAAQDIGQGTSPGSLTGILPTPNGSAILTLSDQDTLITGSAITVDTNAHPFYIFRDTLPDATITLPKGWFEDNTNDWPKRQSYLYLDGSGALQSTPTNFVPAEVKESATNYFLEYIFEGRTNRLDLKPKFIDPPTVKVNRFYTDTGKLITDYPVLQILSATLVTNLTDSVGLPLKNNGFTLYTEIRTIIRTNYSIGYFAGTNQILIGTIQGPPISDIKERESL
jgi:hypothetical protein